MEAAEHIILVAERSLSNEQSEGKGGAGGSSRPGRSSALLLATGPIGLAAGCQLADRLDQSFVAVRELGFHRRKFGLARRCLAILHTRAERQLRERQQPGCSDHHGVIAEGDSELGLRLRAERLVQSWLQTAAASADGASLETAWPTLYNLSLPPAARI